VCVCACQKPKENGSFPPDMCVFVCIWWVAISHLVSAGGNVLDLNYGCVVINGQRIAVSGLI